MSDVMLTGILMMPPELWSDDPISVNQRHSAYTEAAKRIQDDEETINNLESELKTLRESNEELKSIVDDPDLVKRYESHLTVQRNRNEALEARNKSLKSEFQTEQILHNTSKKMIADLEARCKELESSSWKKLIYDDFPECLCDIKLKDGSILVQAAPSDDGDFYVKIQEYEMFIEAWNVTHWKPIERIDR